MKFNPAAPAPIPSTTAPPPPTSTATTAPTSTSASLGALPEEALPTPTLQSQPPGHAHAHAHSHRHARHKGSVLKAPAHPRHRSAHLAPSRHAKRRVAARRIPGAHSEEEGWLVSSTEEDDDVRRVRLADSMRMEQSHRDDSEQGNANEGSREERHFAAIRAARLVDSDQPRDPSAVQAAARRSTSLPFSQALQDAIGSARSVEDLAGLLRDIARGTQSPSVSPGSTSALLMRVARDWLGLQGPEVSGGVSTLASLREALIAGAAPVAPHAPQANVCVWLPIFLLNLDRPRTPDDRERAMARLGLLERAALATSKKG